MRVVVGSTSQHKIEAVRQAFRELFPKFSIKVVGVKTASDIGEQPVGNREILKGATNRVVQCKYLYKKANWCVGIENGIIKVSAKWFDIAWVVVINKDWQRAIAPSAGVLFPKEYVEEAKKRGFKKTTVGSVIAEKTGCDGTDPYPYLTGGRITRNGLLVEAIKIAVAQLLN